MALQTLHVSPPPLVRISSVVRHVCDRYPIARMEVFGEQAGAAAHLGSDVDLLVEFTPDSHPGLLEMGALREDLEKQLGCRVELLSRRAVERSQNPFRRRSILTNPITLYAR